MFGISLTKLLFTAAVIVLIWYAFKWLGRVRVQRDADARTRLREEMVAAKSAPSTKAEDMVQCPACGDYVAAGAASHCGRAACPYPA